MENEVNAIDMLRREHDEIERLARVLRVLSARLLSGQRLPGADMDTAVALLRSYVDQCHYAKEENALLPALQHAGLALDSGPLAQVLAEHRAGRELVERLAQAAQEYGPCGVVAGRDFAALAQEYTDLMSSHVERENNILLPLAEQSLTGAAQLNIREEFDRLDSEVIGEQRLAELRAEMDRLAIAYLPPG